MVYILDYSLVLITCNIFEVDSTNIDDKESFVYWWIALFFSQHSFQRVSVILFEIQLGLLYWRLDTITNSWSSMYRMHVHMLWYEYMTIICYIWMLRFHWFRTNADSKLNPRIDTEPILIGIESSNSPII